MSPVRISMPDWKNQRRKNECERASEAFHTLSNSWYCSSRRCSACSTIRISIEVFPQWSDAVWISRRSQCLDKHLERMMWRQFSICFPHSGIPQEEVKLWIADSALQAKETLPFLSVHRASASPQCHSKGFQLTLVLIVLFLLSFSSTKLVLSTSVLLSSFYYRVFVCD